MIKKILLLLSFISVLSGCGTLTKYRYLSKDSMDTGNGYSSVVVWDLNITAAAYERISYSGRPYFKMTLGGDEISDREATWVSSPDGFSTYHARYIVETKMDILDPWSIEIPINGFGILSIKPKHPLEIKSDSITYAGTYNVEIKGYELDNTGFSTIFNYAHNRDSESLDVVKQWVAQEYPRVYSHLKRQVFSASEYILYEDFEGLNSIHQSYTKWPDLQTEGFSALR
jgi:uncharacterized protein YceK